MENFKATNSTKRIEKPEALTVSEVGMNISSELTLFCTSPKGAKIELVGVSPNDEYVGKNLVEAFGKESTFVLRTSDKLHKQIVVEFNDIV